MAGCILVPLDGSRLSERALAPAQALAHFEQTELYGVQVAAPTQLYIFADMGGAVLYPDQAQQQALRAAERYLAAVQANFAAEAHPARFAALAGDDVAGTLVEAARQAQAGLIVMSSHGYSGVQRWLLGSVAEKVLHAAPCPVWVVRAAAPPKHILIPLDGSPLAEAVLSSALTLAQCFDTQVSLLRAVPEFGEADLAHLEGLEPGLGRRFAEDRRQAAADELADIAARSGLNPARVRTILRAEPAAQAILEYAQQQDVDLVAMSTHGRTGLRRWIYGSVTQKVLDQLPVSMLITRPPAAALA